MSESKGPPQSPENQSHWKVITPQEAVNLMEPSLQDSVKQETTIIFGWAEIMAHTEDPEKRSELSEEIKDAAARIGQYSDIFTVVSERVINGRKLPIKLHGQRNIIALDELVDFENQRLKDQRKLSR